MVSCIDKRSLLSSRSTPNSLCNAGNQIRVGMTLDIEGKYYRVGKSQHVKPGKGVAYVQVRKPYADMIASSSRE